MLQQLLREQGIASGLCAEQLCDGADVVARRRSDTGPDQLTELVLIEPLELDANGSAPDQIGNRGAEVFSLALGRIPVAGDEEHGSAGDMTNEVQQELQACRFRPVEIVEHEHERRRPRCPPNDVGCRLEQQVTSGPQVRSRETSRAGVGTNSCNCGARGSRSPPQLAV